MSQFDPPKDLLATQYNDLDKIAQEFLKYAPSYAQKEAAQAIHKIQQLQAQGVIRSGLYYIVLVDLVGSTAFSAAHGNEALDKRIQQFVLSAFNALNHAEIKNVGLFVKEIGDAALFIFHHFPDILRWKVIFDQWLELSGKTGEPMAVRVCVHIGEVFLQGVNPLSLAVSQTFKMEKAVKAHELVLTEFAYGVAWPTIARAYHGFTECGTTTFDGVNRPVKLYRLVIHDEHDTARILKEYTE